MATVNIMTIGNTQTDNWYNIYPSPHLFGIGNIDYSVNPGGYNWYPSNQQAIDPDGTFMVISDTIKDGITPVGQPYVATWHVASGTTSAAAAALYNRLPFTTNSAPVSNYDDARRAIKLFDSDALMYETNFTVSEFNYPTPQELMLNYDFGNLNSDIRHPLEGRVWNLSPVAGSIGYQFGNQTTTTNGVFNGSYREYDGFTYSFIPSTTSSSISKFGLTSTNSFAMNLRFNISGNNATRQTIYQLSSYFTLETLGNATTIILKWDDGNGHSGSLQSNAFDFQTTTSSWNTVWFGYDQSSDQMFLCVKNTNGAIDIQTQNIAFSTSGWGNLNPEWFLLKNARVKLGAIQYWVGTNMTKASKMNLIDSINSARWV